MEIGQVRQVLFEVQVSETMNAMLETTHRLNLQNIQVFSDL